MLLCARFAEEETEGQRGRVTCLRSYGQQEAEENGMENPRSAKQRRDSAVPDPASRHRRAGFGRADEDFHEECQTADENEAHEEKPRHGIVCDRRRNNVRKAGKDMHRG